MIVNFPELKEEELLYSIFARYHIRSLNTSFKTTLEELFSSRSVTASAVLHSHIDDLILNLIHFNNYTSEELVFKHSLFNYYTAFQSLDRSNKLLEQLKGSDGKSIHGGTGIMASTIPYPKYFKLCPKCVEGDLREGEVTLKRIHQLSSVLICPYHHEVLVETQVLIKGLNKHKYIASKYEDLESGKRLLVKESWIDNLRKIAVLSDRLSKQEYRKREVPFLKKQYQVILMKRGYANANGRYYLRELLGDFIKMFSKELLNQLGCSIDINANSNWLSDLVRIKNSRETNTLKHILMILFLDIDIDSLFDEEFMYEPFGKGPWTCKNKVAKHYGNAVIDKLELKYNTEMKTTNGIFRCNCGYEYLMASGKMEYYQVIKYGHIWEKGLISILEDGLSLRKTAKYMGVDPKTILNYCNKYKIENHFNSNMKLYEHLENKEDIDINADKKLWIEHRNKHPNLNITKLRKMNQGLYMKLYRQNKKWLQDNSPISISKKKNDKRVNWEIRDKELTNDCKFIVGQMMESEKPIKLTVSGIALRATKKELILYNIEKLPHLNTYLHSVAETDEEFRKRRIKWAINELVKEFENPMVWRVYRKAGIREEYQDELKDFTQEQLDQL